MPRYGMLVATIAVVASGFSLLLSCSSGGQGPVLGSSCKCSLLGRGPSEFCSIGQPYCRCSGGDSPDCIAARSGGTPYGVGDLSGELYYTAQCTSDADCAPASRPMRCLTSCPKCPEITGLCWSETDVTVVCRLCQDF